MIDILVQSRRDRRAATRFFRKLLKRQGLYLDVSSRTNCGAMRRLVALCCRPWVHVTAQYANNRAEVSHQPTRQRERQMRRFKSAAQVQRFASVHGLVQNLLPGGSTSATVGSPPSAAKGSIPGVGCGDGRWLNERGRLGSRGATR